MADGDDVRDLVPLDHRIHLIHLEGTATIGEKRNLACDRGAGEIIMHWDDDDWSGPDRMQDQVQRLQESGKQVTGYRTITFHEGDERWFYQGPPDYVVGTSLCYWRQYWQTHQFSAIMVGEDTSFTFIAMAAHQTAAADAGDLMYATSHPNNTSPREKGNAAWRKIA